MNVRFLKGAHRERFDMKAIYFPLLLGIFSMVPFAHASESPIDGTYYEVALRPETYTFTKFTVVLKNGQMVITDQLLATASPITSNLNVLPGGQIDFVNSLPNGIPAGIELYQTSLDFQNSGQLTPITIVKQNLNETDLRLVFYIMQGGQRRAVLKMYDANQKDAFEAAWQATQH